MLKRFVVCFLLMAPCVASAQPTDSLARVLDRIGIGSAVKVNETRGHYFGVRGESLLLETERGATQSVAFADVNDLYRQKSRAKQGAITGAVIGGAAIAGIGMLLVNVSCENSDTHCRGDYPIVAAYGLVIGGAGGGLVGGLIGYAFKRWVRVY